MPEKQNVHIEFQSSGKRVTCSVGTNLLEAARCAGIELTSACGGEGHCGQCRVIILEGTVSEPTTNEKLTLTSGEQAHGYRLACCVEIHSDLKVDTPKTSLTTAPRLQTDSNLPDIEIDPIVRAYPIQLSPPHLEDLQADFNRLINNLLNKYGLNDLTASTDIIRELSPKLRKAKWQVTALVRGNKIVGIGTDQKNPIGFAVDLGTTKIATCLVDLVTGETLSAKGTPNPQIGYGEDVISRLNHVHRNPNSGKILAEKVRQELDNLLGHLLDEAKRKREKVMETCIVGNTAMSHLLLELPVEQLSKSPYVPAITQPINIRAAEIGLQIILGGYVYFPPIIGGFIGSDHVAMLLSTELDQSGKITLGIDIGTNTEISLHIPEKSYLTSASCASGPAFEGAHIGDGMRAASGAIETVHISAKGVEFKTVADSKPVGLCGSGMIDVTAELFRNGLINKNGRFQKEHQWVRFGKKGLEFVLVPSEKSGTNREITISQEDVNEIQLAKGAISGGINILLEMADISADQVEEVIIAGAFGSFIDLNNAISIGLFPKLPNAHYRQVGNAALVGAKWMLVSKSARERAIQIAEKTKYQELATHPKFSQQFARSMLFPEN